MLIRKKIDLFIMTRIHTIIIFLLCAVLSLTFAVEMRAQYEDMTVVEIGTLSTTHIIFNSDLSYVDVSSPSVVVAKVVDASKNMLALKARQFFDFETTISCLEANGRMHTFLVKYADKPSRLVVDMRGGTRINVPAPEGQTHEDSEKSEESSHKHKTKKQSSSASKEKKEQSVTVSESPVSQSYSDGSINVASGQNSNFGMADAPSLSEMVQAKQTLFHIGDRKYRVEAYVSNLYVYSDLFYLILTVYNRSDIGFEAGEAQFTVENLKGKSQSLATDKPMWARSSFGNLSCPPHGKVTVGYTIPKFTLLPNECLRIYIYEKKGTRNLVLTLTDKDINYAVSPK